MALFWLGVLLVIAWLVGWVGFHIVTGAIHLLLVAAIILLIIGAIRWFGSRTTV